MYTFNGLDKKVENLIKDCIQKCKDINIPIAEDITFKPMKGERTYGECCTNRHTGKITIKISSLLVNEDDKINTIFHELIHSCKDTHGHDYRFYSYGSMIYRAYGQKIARCDNKQVVSDIRSSKRKYFKESEWKANPDILVAYTREGESIPLWFVKRGSQTEARLGRCTSFGKKIIKFV